jgi:hypothetical protein
MSEYIQFNKTEGVLNQLLGLAETALPELNGTADAGVIPVAAVVQEPAQKSTAMTFDQLQEQIAAAFTF